MNASGLARPWIRWLWAAFLISLPVTSFPFLPGVLGGAATVRPLAIYGLILLALLVILKRLWQDRLPSALLPLSIFILVALASSGLAVAFPAPPFRDVSALDRVIRNLLTLALGAGYFLAAALLPRSKADLRFTVRWLLAGFMAALAWSSLQAVYVLDLPGASHGWDRYFDGLNEIHHLFSTRNLQEKRVTGLAYEPSWFAEQLSILVLPWLLSGVLQRRSVFRLQAKALILEDFLLAWTVGIMVLTFSRTGLVIMFGLIALSILAGKRQETNTPETLFNRLLSGRRLWARAAVFLALAVALGAVIFSVGSSNRYFSRLWRFWSDPEAGGSYWTYIAFGQRFIYWEAAVDMFETHPFLGVGLGNYALYFEEYLPDIPLYKYPEILDLIVPVEGRTQLVTPKNLFVRTLAETGMLGFSVFAGFLLLVFSQAALLWLGKGAEREYWGRAGALGFIALVLVAFSTDSYAMPNTWIMLGLISAAYGVFEGNRENISAASPAPAVPAAGSGGAR